MNDRGNRYDYPPRVRFQVDQNELDSYRRAADFLNFSHARVLCVQHEFGIYGGPAGSHLLALLKEVRMPVVATLHTVLQNPDGHHRQVVDGLLAHSERLVVMARKGAEILAETYGVPPGRIDVIPHGIRTCRSSSPASTSASWAWRAARCCSPSACSAQARASNTGSRPCRKSSGAIPDVVYLVLGATHPHLLAQEGESYRLSLERLADDLGVKDHVIFYNRFVAPDDLKEFIGACDIYLTPYLNEAQITSGTLAYVSGAGKAVVSTPYWHAQELLAGGLGVLVPFRDAAAVAQGVCAFLDDPARLRSARERAYRLGREAIWPVVAGHYLGSFERARTERRVAPRPAFAGWILASRPYEMPPLRLDHLVRMSDGTGILQHALFNVPNFREGYCTDDNARAYRLCALLDELGGPGAAESIDWLATNYLAFLATALHPRTGRFRNFMDHSRVWLEETGSEDSHGRALWALGTGSGRSRNQGHRNLCRDLFLRGLAAVEGFTSPRAWAFTLLGIHEFLGSGRQEHPEAAALRAQLVDRLLGLWHGCATETWPWFETIASYDNARLSQALLLSGQALNHPEALEVGCRSCPGWHRSSGPRRGISAPSAATASTPGTVAGPTSTSSPWRPRPWSRPAWRPSAPPRTRPGQGRPNGPSNGSSAATTWDCPSMIPAPAAAGDGLHEDRINENQGAESTLAFHAVPGRDERRRTRDRPRPDRRLVNPLSLASARHHPGARERPGHSPALHFRQ